MFTANVFTTDGEASLAIQRLANESGQVTVNRVLDHVPEPYELVRTLNTAGPEVVFLDVSEWDRAAPVVEKIRALSPGTAIIGFGSGVELVRPDELARAGVHALFAAPITVQGFREVIKRAIHEVDGAIQPNLAAFVPAKAGSGCSVTVFHVAAFLADDLKEKVLLIDADLHSGVLCVLAKCSPESYLQDVLDDPTVLNHSQWTGYVTNCHGIDLLPADRSRPAMRAEWNTYYQLLRHTKSEYDRVLVDLPEVVNDATAEVVSRAAHVFIVCTPELLSLELARQRSEELRGYGVDEKRIWVLLNRSPKSGIPPGEVEEIVGHPVFAALPNDYQGLKRAVLEGELMPADTELGKAYVALARKLAGRPVPDQDSSRGAKSRLRLPKILAGAIAHFAEPEGNTKANSTPK